MSLPNNDRPNKHDDAWSDLAAGIRSGDRRAFARLFEGLYGEAVSYSLSLGSGLDAAEDLVQDAFVRLWVNRSRIDPARSIRALLFVSVRNLTLNSARDAANRRRLLDREGGEAAQPRADWEAVSSIEAALLADRIKKWIQGLPNREREAFMLSRYSPLSHSEIADVMGVSKHTVEKHITNALRALRDKLKALHPELVTT